MESKKISETEKKLNKEIIKRMKKVVSAKKDIDLAVNSDITKANINAFKCLGIRSFYKKIADFGIKHNVSVNWIISGKGEMYVKSCLSTSDVVCEPEMPFCTQEESKYVNMVLDVLRGVNEQDKNSLIMNITSFHQHYMERRPVDPDCLKDLEKHVRKETENVNHIKKAQGA